MAAIEEIQFASRLKSPLKFELLRVPYLLEMGYNEAESWEETHLQRMERNFCDPGQYGKSGYDNCKCM